MHLLNIFIIAISLSMDAFSLALTYGTINISKNEIKLLSIIVGIYHFFMPLLGSIIGNIIFSSLDFSANIIVFIILLFIGVEMIIDSFKKQEKVKKISFLEMIMFGLAVSIDSFSIGIGIRVITNNLLIAAIIFASVSFCFTLFGLYLGKKIHQKIGKISMTFGGIVLIFLAFFYLL